ncbi:MAG: hypothetical protein ACYTAF_07925 [Planctomycetota bacterium]
MKRTLTIGVPALLAIIVLFAVLLRGGPDSQTGSNEPPRNPDRTDRETPDPPQTDRRHERPDRPDRNDTPDQVEEPRTAVLETLRRYGENPLAYRLADVERIYRAYLKGEGDTAEHLEEALNAFAELQDEFGPHVREEPPRLLERAAKEKNPNKKRELEQRAREIEENFRLAEDVLRPGTYDEIMNDAAEVQLLGDEYLEETRNENHARIPPLRASFHAAYERFAALLLRSLR